MATTFKEFLTEFTGALAERRLLIEAEEEFEYMEPIEEPPKQVVEFEGEEFTVKGWPIYQEGNA